MPTILVADDNSNIQKMVSLVFEEKGVRVVAVGNGEAACRKLPEVRPDLVLADVFMPVRNGYEVCEFVRQNPAASQTPVILLVGAFDPLDEKEAQRVGANGVLKKPFVPPEPLIEMVQSFLGNLGKSETSPESAHASSHNVAHEQAPQSAAPPPPPPAQKPEPEAEPEEFAFGASAQDFEESGASAAFSEPIAIPAAKHEEKDDEDSEPPSEWERNRDALELDLPGSKGANTKSNATNRPARNSKNKTGFGGANVPLEEEPAPRSTTPWMELSEEAQEAAAETQPAPSPQQSTEAEVSPQNSDSINYYYSESDASENADGKSSAPGNANASPSIEEPAAAEMSVSSQTLDAAEPAAPLEEVPQEASAPSIPLTPIPSTPAETAEPEVEIAVAPTEIETPSVSAYASEETEASQDLNFSGGGSPAAPQGTSTAPSHDDDANSASVDAVVAKVIEKLEPQLKEALANGVLRPLVKEVLEREREKK